MASPENGYKAVKYLVFSMGLVLMGGVIFISTLIYQRQQLYRKQIEQPVALCETSASALGISGTVTQMTQEGNSLTLIASHNHFQTLYVVDSCKGAILRQFPLGEK